MPKNAKKAKCDGPTDRPTDGPTDTVAYRSRVRDKKWKIPFGPFGGSHVQPHVHTSAFKQSYFRFFQLLWTVVSFHLKLPENERKWWKTLKISLSLSLSFSLPFLDASSHLYKRVCPYVRPSVLLLLLLLFFFFHFFLLCLFFICFPSSLYTEKNPHFWLSSRSLSNHPKKSLSKQRGYCWLSPH